MRRRKINKRQKRKKRVAKYKTSPIPIKKPRRLKKRHAVGFASFCVATLLIVQQAQPLCSTLAAINPAAGAVCVVLTGIAEKMKTEKENDK